MVVCFIGHRMVPDVEQLNMRLTDTVSRLVAEGADTFLFGSRSQFDSLCWQVVTGLQSQYSYVKRISYDVPHKYAFTSKDERQRYEQLYSKFIGKEVHFQDYESAVYSQKSLNATKDTYIMRNQAMIDDSDVCVFYYDKNYLPPKRKVSKRRFLEYQPRSGTAVAFSYAKRKKKTIINLFY